MSTDRELLELAAKAAGFGSKTGGTCWTESEYPRQSGNHGALWNYVGHMDTAELWNPLTCDGDALRVAVKLGIEPRGPSRSRSVGRVVQAWYPPDGNPDRSACAHVTVPTNGDRYAATRRAIVRAAAEIGRAMP